MSAKARRPHLPLPDSLPLRAAILAVLSATPVVQAATILPNGAIDVGQFLVNDFTGGLQDNARIARDAAGDFVVVWQREIQGSSNYYSVYAQRYNAAGQAQGSAFLVDTFTGSTDPTTPSVAMDASGDFVIAWTSYGQAASGSLDDIYARQYNAAGTALQASEFLVNTATSGWQRHSAVAMDAAGDFVVAWGSYIDVSGQIYGDIYARQYSAAGSAIQATEFPVNTYTTGSQQDPVAAMDAAGDFVIAWDSPDQAASNSHDDVYARQYHANGSAVQTSEFLVNTLTSGTQSRPAIAMDATGDFVVAWMDYIPVGSNSFGDIYARSYTSAGAAVQTSEFQVSTITTVSTGRPSAAMDAAGDFVVAWSAYNQPASNGHDDIYARRYDANATPLTEGVFLVDTDNTSQQGGVDVAMDAAGDFAFAWKNDYQIYARRFEGPETATLAATLTSSTSSALAGGSFTVTASVSNNTTITTTYGNVDIDTALGDASGIIVSFPLPAGIVPVAVSGNGWSCSTQSSTSLICDYGATLAASTAAANLTITFTGNAIGTLPLQAVVISDQQAIVNVNDLNPTLTLIDVKPTANAGSVSTAGAAVSGTLSATAGYHGQVLSFAIASQPVHGSVTLTNAAKGSFSYTPVAGYTGTDSFTFTAGDGTLNSNAAKETITVTASGSGGGSSSGGGGAFGLFSLALLGLPLRRRMRRAASRR